MFKNRKTVIKTASAATGTKGNKNWCCHYSLLLL